MTAGWWDTLSRGYDFFSNISLSQAMLANTAAWHKWCLPIENDTVASWPGGNSVLMLSRSPNIPNYHKFWHLQSFPKETQNGFIYFPGAQFQGYENLGHVEHARPRPWTAGKINESILRFFWKRLYQTKILCQNPFVIIFHDTDFSIETNPFC